MAENKIKAFPANFLWGAATSAHQVEGHNHNDWSEWEKLGLVKHGEHSGRASGHYERFKADFQLAQDLGHTAHRFSIEWSRIMPKPGVVDTDAVEHYRQVLQELHRLKIEPIVTLHHFTNPIWVHAYSAWTNARIVDDFGQYVMLVVKELGSLVRYWITINEPTIQTSFGYLSDWWPPQRKSLPAAWSAIRNMVAAHQLAYQIIHRNFPSARVGVANNLSDFVSARPDHPLDRGLRTFAHFWHNRWWMDQTYLTQDFIGLNYYFHHPVRFKFSGLSNLLRPEPIPGVLKNDLGWEINPAGLGRMLDWLRQYHRPIIITENGIADAQDKLRRQFIQGHVHEMEQAIQRGADVRGYLYWSLLDNFEWREGFGPRFGLVEVDYKTMQRTIRPSAYAYRDIIQTRLNPRPVAKRG